MNQICEACEAEKLARKEAAKNQRLRGIAVAGRYRHEMSKLGMKKYCPKAKRAALTRARAAVDAMA